MIIHATLSKAERLPFRFVPILFSRIGFVLALEIRCTPGLRQSRWKVPRLIPVISSRGGSMSRTTKSPSRVTGFWILSSNPLDPSRA